MVIPQGWFISITLQGSTSEHWALIYSVRPRPQKTRMNSTATSALLTVDLMCSAIGMEKRTYGPSWAFVLDGSRQHLRQALLPKESFLRLVELRMNADSRSIQKLLTIICCSCMACQNSANSRVDVGRQQCSTWQLILEIADAIQEHDVDFIDFSSVMYRFSLYFSAIQCKKVK